MYMVSALAPPETDEEAHRSAWPLPRVLESQRYRLSEPFVWQGRPFEVIELIRPVSPELAECVVGVWGHTVGGIYPLTTVSGLDATLSLDSVLERLFRLTVTEAPHETLR